jgi:hypothetical protein
MSNPRSASIASLPDQQNHFKLRVELFQFETTTIEEHLKNYIGKVQRQHCSFVPPDVKILSHHDLLQFILSGEQSRAPAFEFYHLKIQLVQQINPSRVFFIGQLIEEKTFFSNSSHVVCLNQPSGVRSTILKLNTLDGFLATPTVSKLSAQNELVVAQFKMAVLLENFSFSPEPFNTFTPVETKQGCLNFPLVPSTSNRNPVQTHFYVPSHQAPPPQHAPPRLLRDDMDTSVQWNRNHQTYISRDKQRHVQDVQNRFRSTSRNRTHLRTQNSQQRDNLLGPVPRPVGQVLQSTVPEEEVLRPDPLPLLQNDPSLLGPTGEDLHRPRTGSLPVSPSTLQGAEGGTNVMFQTETDDLPVVDTPGYTLTLNTGTRLMDSGDVNDQNDMIWDNDQRQYQFSSEIDFQVNSSNPFVLRPPLASSVHRNPSLPSISQDPNAIPTQTTADPNAIPDQTTAPMSQEQTQALAPTDVPIAPSELTATGAISKTPVIPQPQLAPSPRHPDRVVTRSETNSSAFVQSVKKKFGDRSFSN